RHNMVKLGGSRERADELLRMLRKAGVLTGKSRNCSAELRLPIPSRELLAPEAESRALVEGDGWPKLAQRMGQRVSIYGLGRTGSHIAMGLAVAGVGHLHLGDSRPVTPRDRGQVFGPADVGRPRDEALADVFRQAGLECRVTARGRVMRPDATVLVDYEVSDPNRSRFLAERGIAHLSVLVGELSITCGPWVPRSGGPCLKCQRLWAVDSDPCWPGMATQRFVRSAVAQRGEDPCLAAAVGSLAVTQVLQALSGSQPTTVGRFLRMSLPDYETAWGEVESHPRCTEHDPRARLAAGPTPPQPPTPPVPLPPPV
ncbi:MAG: ThiF family adenylyltransferase, partial [Bifidobacteriaceae bacterium]|nr:ThiF family adenylyltransferase [Bifidobacteriaceae bacterium]